MREPVAGGEVVALATALRAENSVALDSVMRLTEQSEIDAVNQAVKLYAAIASVAADPRNPTIGIIADPATAQRESLGRRVLRRLRGEDTLVQWLHVELVTKEDPRGDDG